MCFFKKLTKFPRHNIFHILAFNFWQRIQMWKNFSNIFNLYWQLFQLSKSWKPCVQGQNGRNFHSTPYCRDPPLIQKNIFENKIFFQLFVKYIFKVVQAKCKLYIYAYFRRSRRVTLNSGIIFHTYIPIRTYCIYRPWPSETLKVKSGADPPYTFLR
jgi:hypothetical protein